MKYTYRKMSSNPPNASKRRNSRLVICSVLHLVFDSVSTCSMSQLHRTNIITFRIFSTSLTHWTAYSESLWTIEKGVGTKLNLIGPSLVLSLHELTINPQTKVALIRFVLSCSLFVLGLFPKKKLLFHSSVFPFFFYCISSNTSMKPWVSQWLWAVTRLYKPHTQSSSFFLAHRLSRLSWDADEKVIQEVGAASEAEHRVGQLEGKVGRLAQLASCGARTGQDVSSHI